MGSNILSPFVPGILDECWGRIHQIDSLVHPKNSGGVDSAGTGNDPSHPEAGAVIVLCFPYECRAWQVEMKKLEKLSQDGCALIIFTMATMVFVRPCPVHHVIRLYCCLSTIFPTTSSALPELVKWARRIGIIHLCALSCLSVFAVHSDLMSAFQESRMRDTCLNFVGSLSDTFRICDQKQDKFWLAAIVCFDTLKPI